MTCDYIELANSGVQQLKPYEPGKPIEELERELGLTDIVKLASNENPLGASHKALHALKHLHELLVADLLLDAPTLCHAEKHVLHSPCLPTHRITHGQGALHAAASCSSAGCS